MNFDKAYENLLKGKKIRRKEWDHLMHIRKIGDEVKTFKSEYSSFYTGSNILISKSWLVVDGDGKKLTFLEALEELKNRKFIYEEEWGDNKFLFIDNNQFTLCKAMECDFMPTYQCFCATDWEILK